MTMEIDLRALLRATPAITALTTAIDWGESPQGATGSYVVLSLASDNEGATMQGRDWLRQSRVQVDCYAPTFAQAVAMREAIMDRLHGYRGGRFRGVFFDGARYFREADEAAPMHRMSLDFLTHWRAVNA